MEPGGGNVRGRPDGLMLRIIWKVLACVARMHIGTDVEGKSRMQLDVLTVTWKWLLKQMCAHVFLFRFSCGTVTWVQLSTVTYSNASGR